MATQETSWTPKTLLDELSGLSPDELVRRANDSFSRAMKAATPSLSEKPQLVWERAMTTASESYQYNKRVRDGARYLLHVNSDTAKANMETLEVLLKSSSLRVPVCLKISADANYELARVGYNEKRGTMSKAAKIRMTAAAIDYQLAFGEYAALKDSLQKSLPRDFPVAVLNARFSSYYFLATSAYYRAERAQKLIGGKADKESRADYHALLDEVAQNFRASLDVIEVAKCYGLVLPHIIGQVARGVADDLRRITERYGKTAASHAGTSDWITGVLRIIRTAE